MQDFKRFPVICSVGGINSAGRSSFDFSYKRLVIDNLDANSKKTLLKDLNSLTNSEISSEKDIFEKTLVRTVNSDLFDPDLLMKDVMNVNAAGQLPEGINLSKMYNSRQHPKGIQMTIFGVTDCLRNMGKDWDTEIKPLLDPKKIGVFSGPAIGQLDYEGLGGLLQSRKIGKRASSKHLSMSLIGMSADFINAYVIGSLGKTGTVAGACATFLYNLDLALKGIKNDELDFSIVGSAEAPINPEITDGFLATTGIADDKKILEMQIRNNDDNTEEVDHKNACRPFGDNAGMILGEAAQFVAVTTLEFALENGLKILGGFTDVAINADGFKKSISSPGIGNYITMAQSLSNTLKIGCSIQESIVIAHGTGTFQNRSTESDVLSRVAEGFKLKNWKVTALKGMLGHTMGPAAGDELITALGIWNHGLIPGINTTKKLADDVLSDNLDFCLNTQEIDKEKVDAIYLNAKGFGGNNGSCGVVSPSFIKSKINKRDFKNYEEKLSETEAKRKVYLEESNNGNYDLIYRFKEEVLDPSEDMKITKDKISISDYKDIDL
ncbi:beta-ketoacyl synthase [Gammaproteobacteria bacterium]|nr:beta-ketoacyl synthase [Gammaproteobacteria bacterium]